MKEEWAQDTVEEIINNPRKYTATSKREITEVCMLLSTYRRI